MSVMHLKDQGKLEICVDIDYILENSSLIFNAFVTRNNRKGNLALLKA